MSALPQPTDIAEHEVRKVPISDIPERKRFEWCNLIHIPQSATAISFDPISRRFRSHFESSALFSTRSFENSDCSETQTLIFE